MNTVKCLTCSKEIIEYPSCRRKYCSKKCYGINNTGNKNPSKRPDVRKKISDSKIGEKNWMFGKCMEDCPNWRGGLIKINKLCRCMPEYLEWTKLVFSRDCWTCQKCSRVRKKGDRVIVEAHHIYRFADLIRANKIKTIIEARDCKELWDIENGITLCKECHKKENNYESYSLRKK